MSLLNLRIKRKREMRVVTGYPWVFAGELEESSALITAESGELAQVFTHDNAFIATGYFNQHSAIAFRVLTRSAKEQIDLQFFITRLERALNMRKKMVSGNYYRLVHSEADGLPGLVIDRFDTALVVQITTAGMERLLPLLLEAIDQVIAPNTIVLRADTPARSMEKLKSYVKVEKGTVDGPVEVHENGVVFYADLLKGQKTGWFLDQRENHGYIASHAKGMSVLDIYCHSGGFGLASAKAGAKSVHLVDSSALALELARECAVRNGLDAVCRYTEGKAYDVLEALRANKERYDIVITDPPAFVKTRNDLGAGLKGYEKLAKLAASVTTPGGLFMLASCSHHASRDQLLDAVTAGVFKAGKTGKILRISGAGPDHPLHPHLRESEYLKAICLQID